MQHLDEILRTAQLANYLYTRMVDFLVTLILVSLDLFWVCCSWMIILFICLSRYIYLYVYLNIHVQVCNIYKMCVCVIYMYIPLYIQHTCIYLNLCIFLRTYADIMHVCFHAHIHICMYVLPRNWNWKQFSTWQRWTPLPGELPVDDSDVDDWLQRFLVLEGSTLFFFPQAAGWFLIKEEKEDIFYFHVRQNVKSNL